MGQIITPGSGVSGLTTAISDDVIAYYKFEEIIDLAAALDSKMNFNAVVPAMRAAGKLGNGLPCAKDAANFDANMLLDEIPSTNTVTIEMWLQLTEAIKKGEHGTFTIFSKQWASGMKLYCYLISRLESVELRACFSYSNADASAETLLFEGASGGSVIANGIFYKVSSVKYIQAIDSTWTIEWDGATKWQVKKRDTLGVQVTHFERVNATIAGSYTATIYGEGTTVIATALVPRTDEYIINVGELASGSWHKLYLLLDLRDDYLSKFGVYFNTSYAGGDTAYLVDLPLNTDISPDLLGGDEANVKIASNDATIPYLVDGYPFPSSHRYGLPAIVDEVIVSRILLKPITGATERPKLYLSSQGLGSAAAVPVETDYDLNESVILTATPDNAQTFLAWLINGVDMGNTTPYTLIMTPGDKTVVAVFSGECATPSASPAGGNYSIAQSLVLSCLTSGADIYYTTNGDTPDNGDTLYTTPITIAAGTTLKAIAIKGGIGDSPVMTEAYTFTLPAPVFNPDGGDYGTEQDVVMTCAMVGATIRYTTNGTEPTSGSTVYTTAVHTTDSMTLKAKAFKTNCTTSATKTAIYYVVYWLRKTDFGGVTRKSAVGLVAGGKGYVGTGYLDWSTPSSNDWWEYNPATNAWTRKADFPGGNQQYASGFAIGTKCYVVCENFAMYEYNPSTNLWTAKASVPDLYTASGRKCGVSDGTYGYVFNGSSSPYMYKYDPGTNSWDYFSLGNGPSGDFGVAVQIGTKFYAGITAVGSHVWREYDPAINTWTTKTAFPGYSYYGGASGFSSATKGYIVDVHGDVWQYTPGTNSWVQVADFAGGVRSFGVGFTIGTKGYFGTGEISSGLLSKDFYEYQAL